MIHQFTLGRKRCTIAITVLLVSGAVTSWAHLRMQGNGDARGNITPLDSTLELYGPTVDVSTSEPTDLSGTIINWNSKTIHVPGVLVTLKYIFDSNGNAVPDSVCSVTPGKDFLVTPARPATDFVVTAAPTGGFSVGHWSGAKVAFVTSETRNQNGCLGKRLQFTYAVMTS